MSREQGENGHSSHGAHILFGKRDMEQVLTCYKEDAIKDMGWITGTPKSEVSRRLVFKGNV